ncbi:MAG TPA: DUF2935 domain-containing protein [Bacillus bacterium]|uniref:DUF2935 domain-containing protein n=1 Tax=Siminovitchia fordii TaxID=254759 RepID=UPI0003668B42|nr:DUF2935 domain-containing protein [Siminovitchia fordii]HBZ10626.1 DUF2935 domain-containing protein [Bacillus sp. (in: firmicutes)]
MTLSVQEFKFEHEFWLQVLGDHSRFILESLSSVEKKDIDQSKEFKKVFDELLHEARRLNDIKTMVILTERAEGHVIQLKKFKLSLLERSLVKQVKIHLSPTFINHMINELEEYERIISYLKKEESPPIVHEIHHHLLWLQDAYGHAGAINDNMDAVEKRLKERSSLFTKHFEAFYLKAVEFAGFLRTKMYEFPALARLNSDAKLEIEAFQMFLNELLELDLSAKALGTFPALMADHMYREECYYLYKLAESTQDSSPPCNPAKPRIEK